MASSVVTSSSPTNPTAKGQSSAIEVAPEWTNMTNLASATFGGTVRFATDGEGVGGEIDAHPKRCRSVANSDFLQDTCSKVSYDATNNQRGGQLRAQLSKS